MTTGFEIVIDEPKRFLLKVSGELVDREIFRPKFVPAV